MASKYLLKQAKEQTIEPPPPPLTKKQWWENWWDYHKWHVVLAIVAVCFAVYVVVDLLDIGVTKPDYKMAYVGLSHLSEEQATTLEETLEALGEDQNGDGVVHIQLLQYIIPYFGYEEEDLSSISYPVEIGLIADIQNSESYLFLLETPEVFQQRYHILQRIDGTLPEDDDFSTDGMFVLLSQCAALSDLQSLELPETLVIARRGYWTERTRRDSQAGDALWDAITQGAK